MNADDRLAESESESAQATILLVDDDPSVRKALPRLFRAEGYETEAFASAREFLNRPRFDGDGCLVLDIRMMGMNGLELQDELAKAGFPLPIVFVTGYGDVPMSVRAMKKGAVDFLVKPIDREDLLRAVQTAIDKGRHERRLRRERQQVRDRIDSLTPRERDVMERVVSGLLNKQIAQALAISEATVKVHRGRVMEKMRVASVADLVRACALSRPGA